MINLRNYPTLTERQIKYCILTLDKDFIRLPRTQKAKQLGVTGSTLADWDKLDEVRRAKQEVRKEYYQELVSDALLAVKDVVINGNHRDKLIAARLILELSGELEKENRSDITGIQINIVSTRGSEDNSNYPTKAIGPVIDV